MAEKKSAPILATKNFAFILALLSAGLFLLLSLYLPGFGNLDNFDLDLKFRLRPLGGGQVIQEGAVQQEQNLKINPDILILGVDNRTLSRFGRWPFPRYRHADLLNTLTRIKDSNDREAAVLLDFFFIDSTDDPVSDALLRDSIRENGRMLLETIPNVDPYAGDLQDQMVDRFNALVETQPLIEQVKGDWLSVNSYQGMAVALEPFTEGAAGYGHALFQADEDGGFRRQLMVARYSLPLREIRLADLKADPSLIESVEYNSYQHLGFLDQIALARSLPPEILSDVGKIEAYLQAHSVPRTFQSEAGVESSDYVLRVYQDYFVPAITLRLAAQYFHVPLSDIVVEFGESVTIPSPRILNLQTQALEPYRILVQQGQYDPETGETLREPQYREIPEIVIPIDDQGQMLVNYMGLRSTEDSSGFQTYPVRSYSGYAARATGPLYETWPTSLRLGNKIVMAGAFAQGMADDEKPTPYGLMYGIEVHANALNTILMDNFLHRVPLLYQVLVLFGLSLIVAIYAGRTPTFIALVITIVLLVGFFYLSSVLLFDNHSIILPFFVPAMSALATFILIVVYRVMTEEKDKRRIRNMFGRYVSPGVVDQILQNPPELGGVDKELTVFFSDIRGFTTLSEAMTPQELVSHLNVYLTAMTDIILEFEGTLDKYVGDEIMCFWGAPLPQADHALRACKCALRQIKRLEELNNEWPPEKQIHIGIGVNSGIMTVGNMGSLGRMNYTLMGDNVNLGARLEGTNKSYMTQIIISEYTYGLVKDRVVARELDNIRVKGKNKPVVIYELIDVLDEEDQA